MKSDVYYDAQFCIACLHYEPNDSSQKNGKCVSESSRVKNKKRQWNSPVCVARKLKK